MTFEDMVRRARNRPPSTGEPIDPDVLAARVLRVLSPRTAALLDDATRRPPPLDAG